MTIVASLSTGTGSQRLCSLRPGSAEGWVSIPNSPDLFFEYGDPHSMRCVEDVLYIVSGYDESGASRDALQAYDPSTRTWARRAPIPEPRSYSARVQLAGRLYILGGFLATSMEADGPDTHLTSVFSCDPRTDRWRSESPLPLEDH